MRSDGSELFAEFQLGVHHPCVGLGGTVGGCLDIIARLLHSLLYDGDDTLHEISRLGRFFLDFLSGDAEVVKNLGALAGHAVHEAVHHVVKAFSGVLGLLLGKGKELAELLHGQVEVGELHCLLHQLHVVDGVVGLFAEVLQQSRLIDALEGYLYAFGLFGHLHGFLGQTGHLGDDSGDSLFETEKVGKGKSDII